MRQIHMQKNRATCEFRGFFFDIGFVNKFSTRNIEKNEVPFFHDDFNDNVCRDGMDCETVVPEKRLNPRSNRKPPV